MTTKNVKSWSADGVISLLEKRVWSAPAHVLLREVRNGTGYSRRVTRSADALVVSCWPSRGIWFAGVETKVARYDWLRELKDPDKSAEIQQWCDYWWVAAPVGVVELAEVPETWGLIEVDGKKAKVVKQAPKLQAQPLSSVFVASILRNRGDIENGARARIRSELVAELGEPVSDDIRAMQSKLDSAERSRKYVDDELAKLREQVAAFERDAGVQVRDAWGGENMAAAFRLAQQLQRAHGLSQVADRLVAFASEIRAVEQQLPRAAEFPTS